MNRSYSYFLLITPDSHPECFSTAEIKSKKRQRTYPSVGVHTINCKDAYLSEEAKKQNSPYITIPYNRQQLADYMSVDRSAMSNELCKMRDEGLLEFEKNRFKLL